MDQGVRLPYFKFSKKSYRPICVSQWRRAAFLPRAIFASARL